MNITRLEAGDQAPFASDRIHVWQASPGSYRWSGAVRYGDSAAFASGKDYPNGEDAEADGILWAREFPVWVLVIQLGAH